MHLGPGCQADLGKGCGREQSAMTIPKVIGRRDSTASKEIIRVGAIQSEPVWHDLDGCVGKTIQLIEQAATDGVQVLGFPEMWCGAPIIQATWLPRYHANSMTRDSPQMKRIMAAVKEAGMFVVLGYSEREDSSIYIAQAFISPEGEIDHNRRKIKPTHAECTIWGEGQAESLKTVVDSPFGRIGGLNRWEHLHPLLRYYEYTQGVQIHVSSWPSFFGMPEPDKIAWLYHETAEASSRISQNTAIEGATIVIYSSQILTEKGLGKSSILPGGGFSQIFGADGKPLCEPIEDGEKGILKADVSLGDIVKAKIFIDVAGHSARPDLLEPSC
ncbi:carbon-nitrogen hydrolase [Trichoderma citrinoviride]|uniref:nitrilase n=1 Tax=Trichoderma citrinoviride TaxID=58853 RepID=A0A2T4B1K7_9HYPO|nr:carbon-nitrogen hydrolase [Trichoderma citrinoviride]PTB63209.1 carbon-nitrogen hydrolase [Trichoderma citrinoviride]